MTTVKDEMLAKKQTLGPLHGLPIVIKDIFSTSYLGERTIKDM
jgi:Asp-tRNA(Asn)/Glu-tRNA(Gln) amidotransferase A subunit family amidase